jgi:hypothetical protein
VLGVSCAFDAIWETPSKARLKVIAWTPAPGKETWRMLKMKWMTDLDDRLFATWTQSELAATTEGGGETIKIKMQWRFQNDGPLFFEKANSFVVGDGNSGADVCPRTGRAR